MANREEVSQQILAAISINAEVPLEGDPILAGILRESVDATGFTVRKPLRVLTAILTLEGDANVAMYHDELVAAINSLLLNPLATKTNAFQWSKHGWQIEVRLRKTFENATAQQPTVAEPETSPLSRPTGGDTQPILEKTAKNAYNQHVSNVSIPLRELEHSSAGPVDVLLKKVRLLKQKTQVQLAGELTTLLQGLTGFSSEALAELNELLTTNALGIQVSGTDIVKPFISPDILLRTVEVVPLAGVQRRIADIRSWLRAGNQEVMVPALDAELKCLLNQQFDMWVATVKESEVLAAASEVIAVCNLLAIVGMTSKDIAIAYGNKVLEALGGKKIQKEHGKHLVDAIRSVAQTSHAVLKSNSGSIAITATNDPRYSHSTFTFNPIGADKGHRKNTSGSRFPVVFLNSLTTGP